MGSSVICILLPLLVIGLYVAQLVIGRSVVADLMTVQHVTTRLPKDQVVQIVERAMKGMSGRVNHGGNYLERTFTFNLRKRDWDVVLRGKVYPGPTRDTTEVEISVQQCAFPMLFGAPSVGTSFRKPARVRRKIVAALERADTTAVTKTEAATWELAK